MEIDQKLKRIVVIDTETTGLSEENDEVLELSIVDIGGNELFSSLIRPTTRKRWPNAQKIHGITWNDVKDAPTLFELRETLAPFFSREMVIAGYNVGFDLKMLRASGLFIPAATEADVMKIYRNRYGLKRNSKLANAAGRFHYEFDAHDSLEDARATAFVLRKLLDNDALAAYVDEADRALLQHEIELQRRREEMERQKEERKRESEERRLQEEAAKAEAERPLNKKEKAGMIAWLLVFAVVLYFIFGVWSLAIIAIAAIVVFAVAWFDTK